MRYFRKDGLALVLALGLTSGKLVMDTEKNSLQQIFMQVLFFTLKAGEMHSHAPPDLFSICFLGRFCSLGRSVSAVDAEAFWICHSILGIAHHLCDSLGHEHCLFDPSKEAKGRCRHHDQDHYPTQGQANVSWLARSIWILEHVLVHFDY